MEHMKLPLPTAVANCDLLVESSRKRKAVSVDKQHSGVNVIDQHSSAVFRSSATRSSDSITPKCGEQDYGVLDIKIIGKTEGEKLEDMNCLRREISPKTVDSTAPVRIGTGHAYDSQHAHGLGEKSKSIPCKVGPVTLEKLWDGSLQLNASVKVSAVAYFKSGEKAAGINWPKSLTVKGKVKLDAFENFIQELPRSRTRALMVISLCWKVGSSKTGFESMKEVSKGYKEEERVGYAKPCSSLDIYVCPRTDTIITILAKYGYFNGMAVLEDDQDSMIGCVVWRRNQTSSGSALKRGKRKSPSLEEPPLNFQIGSGIQENGKVSSAIESSERKTATPCSSDIRVEVGNSFSTENTRPITSAADNSPTTLNGSQIMPSSDLKSLQKSPEILRGEISLMQQSRSDKPNVSLEISRAVLPVISQFVEPQKRPDLDDDDLPEFDFNTSCGVSLNSGGKPPFPLNSAHASGFAPADKKLTAETTKDSIQPSPFVLPFGQPRTTTQERLDNSNPREFIIDRHQGKPRVENANRDHFQLSNRSSTGTGTQIGEMKKLAQNNLWDDDDMPEWCPPGLEHQPHLPAAASTLVPSAPRISYPVHNLPKQKTGPVLPPPPPMLNNPNLQPQRFFTGFQPSTSTNTMNPSQTGPTCGYNQFPLTNSSGLSPNPTLRPPSSTRPNSVRPHPIKPPGWRGQRP